MNSMVRMKRTQGHTPDGPCDLFIPDGQQSSELRVQSSVLGSGLAGFLCAIAALYTGSYTVLQTAFVASFGSKLSDTVSSEVGKGYGKTTYLVTTLQRVPPGTEGAVSLEGTLAGQSLRAWEHNGACSARCVPGFQGPVGSGVCGEPRDSFELPCLALGRVLACRACS